MAPARFEQAISAGERSQAYALDRAATGIGCHRHHPKCNNSFLNIYIYIYIYIYIHTIKELVPNRTQSLGSIAQASDTPSLVLPPFSSSILHTVKVSILNT